MKKYLKVLAYETAIIIACGLMATILATHAPWWVLIPLMIIGICAAAYVDYRRFFNDYHSFHNDNK